MLARILAVALVFVSVCLSVTSRCSIRRDERINVVFGIGLLLTSPALYYKKIIVKKLNSLKHLVRTTVAKSHN